MASKMRVLALTLWVVTLGCFAAGWLDNNRAASATGCATLVLYMALARRARSLSLSSTHEDQADRGPNGLGPDARPRVSREG
jgi:hypothetical protein